ncbi:general transcription factor 3C polypeptide 3 [Episyrphus balteatus]|uniref:general transcription factor 3C polypeptide 3 n=1 Tax=Episyrphus balteatus TaxID=286459 RepID=UPI002486CA0B|nr:general transcription factor 3C polypeptide 3 [Episyrphus balteatus]
MDSEIIGDFVIEVLDSAEVPESELSEFQETRPLEFIDIIPDSPKKITPNTGSNEETEETLIQKFVSGEVDFPDVYTRLDAEEDDDKPPPDTRPSTHQEERNFAAFSNQNQTNQVDTSMDEFSNTMHGSARRMRSTFRKRPVLNATLLGLMGEANLSFARGNIEMAEKICLEIIRQNPLAPEPFFTLAEINETRDKEKYMNFLTIAAHLDPHNRDQWIRIAELYIEQKNYSRARIYYSKAIKCLNKDYDLRLRKAKLLELMNERNNAMYTYLKMIPLVPVERGELCLVTAKNVATYFYAHKKMGFALEALEGAYGVARHIFSAEELNLYLEMLLINKKYRRILQVLQEQADLELITEKQANSDELVIFCVIPDQMVADLRAKLCISLIQLKAFHLLEFLISNVHKYISLSKRVDLYIDIAEAMMRESKFEEASQLLLPIVTGDHIDPPAFVWLKYAECLRELHQFERAIECYYKVVELAPYCYEAKFTLSALLKQQGRPREALKALEQDLDGEKINPRLLYERCLMLKGVGEIDQYVDVGYVLLARNSLKLNSREEMLAASNGSSFVNIGGVKTILETRLIKQDEHREVPDFGNIESNSDLAIADEYELFLDLVSTCFKIKKYAIMEKLCFAMVTTKRFMQYTSELECIGILACYYNNDTVFSFAYFREMFSKNFCRMAVWNFYTTLIQKGEDLRYHRFLRRALARGGSPSFMRIFLAHYHLYCCSYKYALNIYVPMLKEHPEPIVYLCISVVFSQIALQKKVLRKTAAIGQALVFMKKYAESRMCGISTQQEIFYNLGRLYHQSCMTHLALHYYEKALAFNDDLLERHENLLSLKNQIAFNIHLIYRASGNKEMARQYLYKYIII